MRLLNLGSPWSPLFSHNHSSLPFSKPSHSLSFLLFSSSFKTPSPKAPNFLFSTLSVSPNFKTRASDAGIGNGVSENPSDSSLLNDALLNRVSAASADAAEALQMIAEMSEKRGGVVGSSDCFAIIAAALDCNNSNLALSIFSAMRSSFNQAFGGDADSLGRWKWSRPDVRIYTLLVRGLAASLRVSDALRVISEVCQSGVAPAEEVPFGKVVKCPSCKVAIGVAQPQHGIQIVSCSKCRYQYELVSGDITTIESKQLSNNASSWGRGLLFMQTMKQNMPAALHSIVVETPSGVARTHKFATGTVDLPAQLGERVTIASAAPSNVYREIGPFRLNPKPANYYPGEPMCLTNHQDGRESLLLRAPPENESSLLSPSNIFPLFAVLATGDAATGIIDPNLPRFISIAVAGSLFLGATINTLVLPQLNRLPQKRVDAIALKQELLSQYEKLQSRIMDLKQAAEKEVWMLARMCQLENKIAVVGEPSYRARSGRVKSVRESLENSLSGRIELIESYARISSMIEIEVEMDSDVLAAEATSSVERLAEQIQQIVEIESLEEKWRIQAEANDEAERLLSSQTISSEKV